MPTYLSFSFENTVFVQVLCKALGAEKIEYLEPPRTVVPHSRQTWIKAGESLREQLRVAIKLCDCCVFVVTPESLASDWCMIETAAFWGANKKIISYVTLASVEESQLPPHLRGDYVTRDLEEVLTAVRDALKPAALNVAIPPVELVRDLSVDRLQRILRSMVGPPLLERSVQDRLLLIRGLLESPLGLSLGVKSTAFLTVLNTKLWDLVGLPPDEIRKLIGVIWPETFDLQSSNGPWTGFAAAKMQDISQAAVRFNHCLLIRVDGAQCNSVAVVQSVIGNAGSASLEGVVDACGEPLPSTFISLSHSPKSHMQEGDAL